MVTTVISLCWKWIRFPPHRLPLRSLSHEASWCIGPSPQPVLEATKQQVLNCLLSKNHRFVEVRRFILTPTLMVYPWFILSIILPTTSGILGTPHFKSMKCKLSWLSWRTAQVNCSWHSFPPISSTQWLLHALLLKCHSYLQKENISPYIYISTIEIWCRCTFTRKACKELRQLQQLLCWSVMVSPHLGARAEFKSDMLGSAPVCQRMPGCVTKLRMRSHESTNINHNATFCFWLVYDVYEART